MDKIIAFYLRSISNKHIDMLYKHVMRLELYFEQFAVGALVGALGCLLVYLAGCMTAGNPLALSATGVFAVWYGAESIADIDALVLKEWRARAWIN